MCGKTQRLETVRRKIPQPNRTMAVSVAVLGAVGGPMLDILQRLEMRLRGE
jgi:hypothetical protein